MTTGERFPITGAVVKLAATNRKHREDHDALRARRHRALRPGCARRIAGACRRSLLQGQAPDPDHQLRRRWAERHRRSLARQASGQAHRRLAQHHRAEQGRRRRPDRRDLSGRARAEGRLHVRLFHRRGLDLRHRSVGVSRRSQDLRVHRLPARQLGLLRARRHPARHQGRHRRREGQGPGGRRALRRCLQGYADPARARHARRAADMSPATAATPRRGWRCSRTRSISSPRPPRPISAWSIRA